MKRIIEIKCKCGGRLIVMGKLDEESIFFKCSKCGKIYTIYGLCELLTDLLKEVKK